MRDSGVLSYHQPRLHVLRKLATRVQISEDVNIFGRRDTDAESPARRSIKTSEWHDSLIVTG
jgi:hypothetical protein